MKPTDRLEQVGILRQALKPLLHEADTEKIGIILNPIVAILEKMAIEIQDLTDASKNLEKRELNFSVDVPAIKVLSLEVSQLKGELAKLDKPQAKTDIGNYRPHDQDDLIQGTEYAGFVAPDGAWLIMRAQNGQQRYAAGTSDYQESWEKRQKQSYDYLDKVS